MDALKELAAEYDRETANTRKVLAAIPDDADYAYTPHPKSMSLGRLAGHISDTAGNWGKTCLTTDKLEFDAGHKFEPYIPAGKKAMLDQFDKQVAEAKAALAAMTLPAWDDHWKFIMGGNAFIDDTKYNVFRTWVLNHMIHHRAQLGVYLRMLDKPVPGCYGPSADEM